MKAIIILFVTIICLLIYIIFVEFSELASLFTHNVLGFKQNYKKNCVTL